MAKRPPQRPIPRKTGDGGALPFLHAADAGGGPREDYDEAAGSADVAAHGGTVDRSRLAGNRSEFVAFLGDVREQGGLGVADEAAILREYDSLLAQLRAERGELEREYRTRLTRDGQDETEAWLKQAAEALGRRQGEQMRRLLDTIPAFAAGQAATG